MSFFDKLFQESTPLSSDLEGGYIGQLFNLIGNFGYAFGMIAFGIVLLYVSRLEYPPSRIRKVTSVLLSSFLIFAGLSRFADGIAYWHNYIVIRGIIKMIGIVLFVCHLPLMPFVIKRMKEYKNLMEIQKSNKDLNNRLDQLEKLDKK